MAFAKAWRASGVYAPYYCHENLFYLFRKMKKQLPHLEARDFQVILLAPEQGHSPLRLFPVFQSRGSYVEGHYAGPTLWSYHAILRYRNIILDLDFGKSPKVLRLREYIEALLPKKEIVSALNIPNVNLSREDLFAFVIPGEEFLSLDLVTMSRRFTSGDYYFNYKSVPLEQWIDSQFEAEPSRR